jgi:aminoglycoside N3'-acetyltransferase
MQSVPITTNVVGSNSVYGEVYSIQHYVIIFGSDLPQVAGFHPSERKETAFHLSWIDKDKQSLMVEF